MRAPCHAKGRDQTLDALRMESGNGDEEFGGSLENGEHLQVK